MATHKSADKRHRQSLKRQARNTALKARLRTLVKKARVALEAGDVTAAETRVAEAARALDKAVGKGVLHRNNAARKISRMTARVHAKKKSATG
ncbi:MAG: 30S ribosomal protein S20 [Candidatus Binatia bacterium]